MDKVLREERDNFAKIEQEIGSVASRHETKATALDKEIQEFHCVDYEDRQQLARLRKAQRKEHESAQAFRDYQASPYFGRLDLDPASDDSADTETFYIGKTGISDGENVIVVDWRTPVGSCYYASNQKQFSINETAYNLALRRSLEIKDGSLLTYRTEYDGESVSLEGDIVDPFLLTVLKDKRRKNRLTDIIRTIQANQNEIIRKPRRESFVVQGCAGSGKTMILLHRLSYLMFNNRDMSFEGTKIITPNKFFDAHINDLSSELGLTSIERFSVEEYYAELIRRYSSKLSENADVRSERELSTALLSQLYSLGYQKNAINHYHEYWHTQLLGLDESRLHAFFDKRGLPYPDTQLHTERTVDSLEYGLRTISSAMAAEEKKRDEISSRLESVSQEIVRLRANYAQSLTRLTTVRDQTCRVLSSEKASLENSAKLAKEKVNNLQAQENLLLEQKKKNSVAFDQASELQKLFAADVSTYAEYAQFVQKTDALSNMIRDEYASELHELEALERIYSSIPVYNFGKRGSVRRQLAESKEHFSRLVTNFFSSRRQRIQVQLNSLRGSSLSINDELKDIENALQDEEKRVRQWQDRYVAVRACLAPFQQENFPDFQTKTLSNKYQECADILSSYKNEQEQSVKVQKRLDSFLQIQQDLEQEKKGLEEKGANVDDSQYINSCLKIVRRLRIQGVFRNVLLKDLLETYKTYGQPYQKSNYRHKLYLRLLYCSLYFSLPLKKDNFLNIDEAQDLSVAEYKLLRQILGENCTFNLYGDINQLVYSYKGITDWEDISDITGKNIYVLNENYRNTLQITEFCNQEFEADVYPIGVSSSNVLETDSASSIDWLLKYKKQFPASRVAIIYRYGLKEIDALLRNQLNDDIASWDSVDDNKISVISVETAKGLEFEAVVVFIDQMSNNEKYISYTRALDCLTVVRDKFSSEVLTSDNEGIDDDFLDSENALDLEEEPIPTQTTEGTLKNPATLEENNIQTTEEVHQENEILTTRKILTGALLGIYTAALRGVHKPISPKKRFDWGECDDEYRSAYEGLTSALFLILCKKLSVIEALEFNNDIILPWNVTITSPNPPIYKSLGHPAHQEKAMEPPEKHTDKPSLVENQTVSPEDAPLVREFDEKLATCFDTTPILSPEQQKVILSLYHGHNTAFNAPSGSLKSVILYLLAEKAHQTAGKQTLLTSEAHLQENELVLAERLGLKGGVLLDSMDRFMQDFKKDKYDIIFVSFDFFRNSANLTPFMEYFSDRVAYWGINHPASEPSLWKTLSECGDGLHATMYLMTKDVFPKSATDGYELVEIKEQVEDSLIRKRTFYDASEKLPWLLEHTNELYGQGLIYCNEENTCKMLSKQLRKHKIMAEAYIDVANPLKRERINYLTNSFSSGGLPVLITTQEAGKNLSNPHIRFILHYDVPVDDHLHALHVSQLGSLAQDPFVFDFCVCQPT